jgi:hypothetical protein
VSVSSWSSRLAIAVALALSAVSVTSCKGGSGQGPTDASSADNRAADQRLQGNWRIVDFKPESALDPSMASMLAFYQNNLVVQIQGGRMRALSSGINFDRRYEVKKALGTRFQLVVYDDAGVAQTNYCEFLPDGTMRAKTQTPWRGDALFARAP